MKKTCAIIIIIACTICYAYYSLVYIELPKGAKDIKRHQWEQESMPYNFKSFIKASVSKNSFNDYLKNNNYIIITSKGPINRIFKYADAPDWWNLPEDNIDLYCTAKSDNNNFTIVAYYKGAFYRIDVAN